MTRIKKCLAAYNHVLKILEINNDNYFKRTQILMIVAQVALFTAFGKVFALDSTKIKNLSLPLQRLRPEQMQLCAPLMIAILGAAFAQIWCLFIRRQCNVLDLCKGYLRGIEDYLMQLGIPSGYWTYESKLSHPKPRHIQPVVRFTMDPRYFTTERPLFPFPLLKNNCKLYPNQSRDQLPRQKPKLRCRYRDWRTPWRRRKSRESPRYWIGLTKIEKWIAVLLTVIWGFLFLWAISSLVILTLDC